jgi:hypothetical protein
MPGDETIKPGATTPIISARRNDFTVRFLLSVAGSFKKKPTKDRRPSLLGGAIGSPSLEKDIAEVGPVYLRMTHRASLIFR